MTNKMDAVKEAESQVDRAKAQTAETQRLKVIRATTPPKESGPPPAPPPLPKPVKSSTNSDKTPAMGTPMLPKPVKSSNNRSSSSSSSTSTKTASRPKPSYEEARKIVKNLNANRTPASPEPPSPGSRAASRQEWVAKIQRVLKNDHKDEFKFEHLVVAALAFVPKERKLQRIRTLMSLINNGPSTRIDAKTAKMIYDDAKVETIPYIDHPMLESPAGTNDLKRRILHLNKQVEQLKKVRTEAYEEVRSLDFELIEARDDLVKLSQEMVKVLKFFEEQINKIFAIDNDAPETEFAFMRRVLQNEISTFMTINRRAEMQANPDGESTEG